jgi:hypothetical protein
MPVRLAQNADPMTAGSGLLRIIGPCCGLPCDAPHARYWP